MMDNYSTPQPQQTYRGDGKYTFNESDEGELKCQYSIPVSYTHLDVYKRQVRDRERIVRDGLRFGLSREIVNMDALRQLANSEIDLHRRTLFLNLGFVPASFRQQLANRQ